MSKSKEPSFGDFFKLPNPGLRAYFGNVVKGQSNIYEAPFAKGVSTKQLLRDWEKELVSIAAEWPTLYAFEQDLRKKVGPLSVMLPLKERMKDINAYYDDVRIDNYLAVHEQALRAVLSEWRPAGKLRLRSEAKTLEEMKKSTNSGSPYFRKRRDVVPDTIPVRRVWMDSTGYPYTVRQKLAHSEWDACAVLGWRGQEGGISKYDVKQRVVFMFPFAVNIRELQVYQPLIVAAQFYDIVPAWVSMDSVDEHVTRLFDTKRPEDLVVCTDFTKFDQHFNPMLQDAAYWLLENIFADSADMRKWLRDVFQIKYSIPLAYNMGRIKFGPHGMGSGSGGTNADETLAHRALQYEAAITHGARLNPHSMCLGDDGILSYPGITVDDVTSCYASHGLEMNDQKQYASKNDCTYLRRWHHKDYRVDGVCVGVYSTFRALGRLRYVERYMDLTKWGPKAVALRQLSILENIKFHPLKEQFVQFCMKRDKFRLGLDIPHFLDDLPVLVKEMTDSMPDFLGYTKSLQTGHDPTYGINSWWIVNYLRSQR